LNSHPNVSEAIAGVIQRVLQDSGRPVPHFSSDALLAETLQLDSLDLAVTVVTLERELGVDPFRQGPRPVRTFGEFVAVYEAALAGS
jgi:acyl carrier protein